MGGRGIKLFDEERNGLFSISNFGSQWDGRVNDPVAMFASVSQMGMGFGVQEPNPSSGDSQHNGGMNIRIPCTELYVRYVQSEGKVKITGVHGEEEGVAGVKGKKKGVFKGLKIKVKNPSLRRLISGAFAGAVSRTTVAPLETIRTHLMVGSSGNSTGEVFNNIMKTDGWKGLFRGNFVNVIRVAPSKAIEVTISHCMIMFYRLFCVCAEWFLVCLI